MIFSSGTGFVYLRRLLAVVQVLFFSGALCVYPGYTRLNPTRRLLRCCVFHASCQTQLIIIRKEFSY